MTYTAEQRKRATWLAWIFSEGDLDALNAVLLSSLAIERAPGIERVQLLVELALERCREVLASLMPGYDRDGPDFPPCPPFRENSP